METRELETREWETKKRRKAFDATLPTNPEKMGEFVCLCACDVHWSYAEPF